MVCCPATPLLQDSLKLSRKPQPEIQIVDTPNAPETSVNASFAAGHRQINRTLLFREL